MPLNIASCALLTLMVAQQTGLEVGDFVWTGGDCHIYDNHVEQIEQQLAREPFSLPVLRVGRTPASILNYELGDFEVVGAAERAGQCNYLHRSISLSPDLGRAYGRVLSLPRRSVLR